MYIFPGLKLNLKEDVFGQHLVSDIVVNALNVHFNQKVQSGKPLVMMLQGQSGTGKTYVAEKIVSFTYKKGKESAFVRQYVGRSSFPLAQNIESYNVSNFLAFEKHVLLIKYYSFY